MNPSCCPCCHSPAGVLLRRLAALALVVAAGDGVKRNYRTALKHYLRAAGLGNSDAQFNAGLMYDKGEGTRRDIKRAVYWYRRAARNGDQFAMCNLGVIYCDEEGFKQNRRRARLSYRIFFVAPADFLGARN